jgi:hypothetical protein
MPALAPDRVNRTLALIESSMNMARDEMSKLFPTAKQIMRSSPWSKAEKASEEMRAKAKANAKALIDTKSSGVSDEERLKRAANIIQRAVKNGLTEVEIWRFPNALHQPRARHQQQPGARLGENAGWSAEGNCTNSRDKHLKPRGYKIRFQVADFSGGVPRDIGITLKWS